MNIALDTNRYTDFCRNQPDILQRVQQANDVVLPFSVIAELRSGFLRGTRAKENEQILTQFLARPRVEIIYPDEQTTHHFARLTFQLRQQGTPIPVNDIWLAAVVVQHNLMLCSRDRHFDHLPQIPRI